MKKVTYILSKLFFYGFALFFVFVFLFSILAFVEYYTGWNVPFVELSNENAQLLERIEQLDKQQKIALENNVDCPIISTVAKLVDGKITSKQAVEQLLARPLRQESE